MDTASNLEAIKQLKMLANKVGSTLETITVQGKPAFYTIYIRDDQHAAFKAWQLEAFEHGLKLHSCGFDCLEQHKHLGIETGHLWIFTDVLPVQGQ